MFSNVSKIKNLILVLLASTLNCADITKLCESHNKSFLNTEEDISKELAELKKREIVTELLFKNKYSYLNEDKVSNILAESSVLNDINMVNAQDDSGSLLNRINRTQTIFGESILLKMICQPTTDVKHLLVLQNAVRKLTENSELCAQISEQLYFIKENEDSFLKLWIKKDKEIDKLFWNGKVSKLFNKSSFVTEGLNDAELTLKFLSANIITLMQTVIDEFSKSTKPENKNGWLLLALKTTKKFLKESLNPVDALYTPLVKIKNDYKAFNQNIDDNIQALENEKTALFPIMDTDEIDRNLKLVNAFKKYHVPKITASGRLFLEIFKNYQRYQFYKARFDRNKIVRSLQKSLSDIQKIVIATEKIEHLLQNNNLKTAVNLKEVSSNCQNLINDLKKSTFHSESIIYFEGRVLKCYYQIQEIKSQLANIFAYIGEVDALVSVAKLFKENNSDNGSFCFVEFVENEKPYIKATDFWSVFIDKNNLVKNDLEISENIILTGANAGGKSTTIKAFLQNIIFAQTFGIAAASEFKMTPFSKIFSYLNIADDLGNGKSLFKAEVERALSLVNGINNLKENEFAFCAIDELFTGTSAEAGEKCAYDLVKKINQNSNSVFIFATHYQSLTSLENTNGNCHNYKVMPPIKNGKKLVYPFKIERGINTVNIAADILEESGIF